MTRSLGFAELKPTIAPTKRVVTLIEEMLLVRKRVLATAALPGYDGAEVRRQSLAHFAFVVRSDDIPRIQEVQASTCRVIREELEESARG